MTYCPSQDWDRYADEQDRAVSAEMDWLSRHRAEILQVTCALLAGGRGSMDKTLLHDATEIVRELSHLCEGDES